jgi:hypothetical protein|tara:strand:+ start:18176 stop:18412 length:237 start_codon:yes stop_codon:yes gene_type:complete
MPQYKVVSKGFFGGKLYDPDGKRSTLNVDKPFTDKTIPSWVKPMVASAAPKAKKAKTTAPKTEPSFMEDDASKSVETL